MQLEEATNNILNVYLTYIFLKPRFDMLLISSKGERVRINSLELRDIFSAAKKDYSSSDLLKIFKSSINKINESQANREYFFYASKIRLVFHANRFPSQKERLSHAVSMMIFMIPDDEFKILRDMLLQITLGILSLKTECHQDLDVLHINSKYAKKMIADTLIYLRHITPDTEDFEKSFVTKLNALFSKNLLYADGKPICIIRGKKPNIILDFATLAITLYSKPYALRTLTPNSDVLCIGMALLKLKNTDNQQDFNNILLEFVFDEEAYTLNCADMLLELTKSLPLLPEAKVSRSALLNHMKNALSSADTSRAFQSMKEQILIFRRLFPVIFRIIRPLQALLEQRLELLTRVETKKYQSQLGLYTMLICIFYDRNYAKLHAGEEQDLLADKMQKLQSIFFTLHAKDNTSLQKFVDEYLINIIMDSKLIKFEQAAEETWSLAKIDRGERVFNQKTFSDFFTEVKNHHTIFHNPTLATRSFYLHQETPIRRPIKKLSRSDT